MIQFALGVIFLALSLAAAGTLAYSHYKGIQIPGCGIGGACDQAAKSIWSPVGVAYFAALFLTWLIRRGEIDHAFVWIVRLGLVISLVFVGAMISTKLFCQYCAATHVGNFLFWIVVESINLRHKRLNVSPSLKTAGAFALLLAACGFAMGTAEFLQKRSADRRAQQQLNESTKNIIEKSTTTQPTTQSAKTQPVVDNRPPFTGRYRFGPENAAIRIVVISDYQCADCKNIERQVKILLDTRTDVSFSAKHFPMCAECNTYMNGQTMHPNACWAAKAAEAVGIVKGNDAFWKMHFWLFDHNGLFQSKEDLQAGLIAAGLSPTALGLHFTPMVFINGVELRGFRVPDALLTAVNRLAENNLSPGTAAQDHPPMAVDKYVKDWQEQRILIMSTDTHPHTLGPDNAKVKIEVFSNYSLDMTTDIDALVHDLMKNRNDVQYNFRQYPLDQACNSQAEKTMFANDCLAARAAEAAAIAGGNDAFWKLHAWLLKNQKNVSESSIKGEASELGLDANAFAAAMSSAQVQAAIQEDAVAFKETFKPLIPAGFPQGVPTVYVNNRFVPRWKLEKQNVLERIVNEAARQ